MALLFLKVGEVFMEFWIRLEFYAIFLVYPVVIGLLIRYKKIKLTFKQILLITNTLICIFSGTLTLAIPILDQPSRTISTLSSGDWMFAIVISVSSWIFLFLITLPFQKS